MMVPLKQDHPGGVHGSVLGMMRVVLHYRTIINMPGPTVRIGCSACCTQGPHRFTSEDDTEELRTKSHFASGQQLQRNIAEHPAITLRTLCSVALMGTQYSIGRVALPMLRYKAS